jgi:hypothetical protein
MDYFRPAVRPLHVVASRSKDRHGEGSRVATIKQVTHVWPKWRPISYGRFRADQARWHHVPTQTPRQRRLIPKRGFSTRLSPFGGVDSRARPAW